MYAVVETGGKQYKVSENDVITVEHLDANVGDKVTLPVLLLVDGKKVTTGNPVKGAEVVAEVLSHGKGDKVVVFKYKAKKNERKKQGHRQPYTELKIVSVK
ncbi:MAG: 50S ribosomal protein L21 [Clostridia bacterium]|nr:50S ribosomal protein L21 [Clostridia bacterium]